MCLAVPPVAYSGARVQLINPVARQTSVRQEKFAVLSVSVADGGRRGEGRDNWQPCAVSRVKSWQACKGTGTMASHRVYVFRHVIVTVQRRC
jgi:hypothetical protein